MNKCKRQLIRNAIDRKNLSTIKRIK